MLHLPDLTVSSCGNPSQLSYRNRRTFQSDTTAENSRPSITLRASPASMATRIRICKDGASFVQMEFIRSYGVDRNKEGNVARWLWKRVSISRISSPKKKNQATTMKWELYYTSVSSKTRRERKQFNNPLEIMFYIHSQHFHATFLNKNMKSITYDYRFTKNTALCTNWASFISLKRNKVHPSNKQWRPRGGEKAQLHSFFN